MSDESDNGDSDDVGYGRPPKSKRFVKGQSGNPKGRPRSPKRISLKAIVESEFEKLFSEEMEREVSIREGEKIEKVSVQRAAVRAMSLKAAKGDIKSYRELANTQTRIDCKKSLEWEELAKTILTYKENAIQHVYRRTSGHGGPEIIPHPLDIHLDAVNQTIMISGPITASQKMAQDFIVRAWPFIERDLLESRSYKEGDPAAVRQYRKLAKLCAKVLGLVVNRTSRENSWESANKLVKLAFLREHIWPEVSKDFPVQFAQSEFAFRGFFRHFVPFEPTEEEEEEFISWVKELASLEFSPARGRLARK